MHKEISIITLLFLVIFLGGSLSLQAQTLDELMILMRQGQSAIAIDGLKKQVSENPTDIEARCLLALAYAWNQQFDNAEDLYQAVLKENSKYREALLGLARLRGYQSRPMEGIELVESGLAHFPGDRELMELEINLIKQSRGQKCDQKYRHAVRSYYEKENYSFTDNGQAFYMAYEDQKLYGWNTQMGFQRIERFNLMDSGMTIQSSHALPWRRSRMGMLGGVSNNHTLLPRYLFSIFYGMPLGARSEIEAAVTRKRYEDATVNSFSPWIYYEFPVVGLTFRYSLSKTNYDSGQDSPALSSYGFRAQLTRLCPLKPWISYSRTNESFESGNATVVNGYSANHYALGTLYRFTSQYELNLSYALEDRFDLHQQVQRWGVGLNYYWDPE